MRVVITGGAGFVGSSLALATRAADPRAEVWAFDNLRRRGSELNVQRLQAHGVRFVHGDVRSPDDLATLPSTFDLLIDASAEPSVHAGVGGSPAYVLQTNLVGTMNVLELCRQRGGALVFLSTSRVYSIEPLRALALVAGPTRFELGPAQPVPGVTARGISEAFPVHLPRSLYGASKLASEYLVQEYVATYGLKAVINRCGVIAGPGQFGKVDQGVFTLWVAAHVFGLPLRYTGFGGTGLQVRDLLHPSDLHRAIALQLASLDRMSGRTFNLGGGPANATSLLELTRRCRALTGADVPVGTDATTSPMDVPWYVTDASGASEALGWTPQVTVDGILSEIHAWLSKDRDTLKPLFTTGTVPGSTS